MCSKTVFIKTKQDLLPVRFSVLLLTDGALCFYVRVPFGWGRDRRGGYRVDSPESVKVLSDESEDKERRML